MQLLYQVEWALFRPTNKKDSEEKRNNKKNSILNHLEMFRTMANSMVMVENPNFQVPKTKTYISKIENDEFYLR